MSYNSSVMLVQEFNKEKFINVLLFFLDHANNARLGETKLMKLFYFLDFGYFQLHQKSVTGAMYVHYQHGPIPSEGKTILNELVKKKIIKCVTTSKVRYPQKRFLTNCLFNEDLFDEQELQHMWAVVIKFDSYTAKAVEEMSHNEPPWIITKQGEYIDYSQVYAEKGGKFQ
ncbi:SocA family protein [bacterium]|nr:SocA family protein [bacterium]MBU1024883.1 SocA family protein [bacterium]